MEDEGMDQQKMPDKRIPILRRKVASKYCEKCKGGGKE